MNKKRFGILLIGLATLTAVYATFLTLTQYPPTYTIIDESGAQIDIAGDFDTVRELVHSADIALRPQDIVRPGLSATPPVSEPILIERAEAVQVRHGTSRQTYWTHQESLGSFLSEVGIQPKVGQEIIADGKRLMPNALHAAALPDVVEIGSAMQVTIVDGGGQQVIATSGDTVADALIEAEIPVNSSTVVSPSLTSPIEPNMAITLQRGFEVTLVADGTTQQLLTTANDIATILAQNDVALGELDYTIPGLETAVQPNETIQIVRVTEETRIEESELPYQTVWQASPEMDLDTEAIISYGQPGIFRREVVTRYEDGVLVGESVVSEGTIQEPVNEVYGYGTNIVIRTVDTPEGPREYWRVVQMRVTAYTPSSSGRAPDDPAYGITASGVPAGYGVVAVDRSVVPFRSHVYVPGYGVAFAGDTGGGVRGRWIDLGYNDGELVSWSGYVDVYYLTPVPSPDNINYILPAVLP